MLGPNGVRFVKAVGAIRRFVMTSSRPSKSQYDW